LSTAHSTLGHRQRSVCDMLVPSYSVLWATNVMTEIIILESADTLKHNEIFKPTLSEVCNARKYTAEFDIKNKVRKYRI
jgi:hypothetical protein